VNILHRGRVERGQFVPNEPLAWQLAFNGYEGQNVTVKISRVKRQRSNNQNAYLWGVVYKILAQYSGHTENELHDVLGEMFLPKKERPVLGHVVRCSTSELSTVQFEEYLVRLRVFASVELGVVVPLPNEIDQPEPPAGY